MEPANGGRDQRVFRDVPDQYSGHYHGADPVGRVSVSDPDQTSGQWFHFQEPPDEAEDSAADLLPDSHYFCVRISELRRTHGTLYDLGDRLLFGSCCFEAAVGD